MQCKPQVQWSTFAHKKIKAVFFSSGDLSLEGGSKYLPQTIVINLSRTCTINKNHIGSAVSEILRYRKIQIDKQTDR